MVSAALWLGACSAPGLSIAEGPFRSEFVPPSGFAKGWGRLTPLGPEHAAADLATILANRDHLLETLRWGDWPPQGLTLEENRAALVRHQQEFERREAFAYTLLAPAERAGASGDRIDAEPSPDDLSPKRVLGCVYLESPFPLEAEAPASMLAFLWVTEAGLKQELDRQLLEGLEAWFESEWPVEEVFWPIRIENLRGSHLVQRAGYTELPSSDLAYRVFRWRRGGGR